jgi:hypothetical protein
MTMTARRLIGYCSDKGPQHGGAKPDGPNSPTSPSGTSEGRHAQPRFNIRLAAGHCRRRLAAVLTAGTHNAKSPA